MNNKVSRPRSVIHVEYVWLTTLFWCGQLERCWLTGNVSVCFVSKDTSFSRVLHSILSNSSLKIKIKMKFFLIILVMEKTILASKEIEYTKHCALESVTYVQAKFLFRQAKTLHSLLVNASCVKFQIVLGDEDSAIVYVWIIASKRLKLK